MRVSPERVKQTVLGLGQVQCRFSKNFSCTLPQAPSVTQVAPLHLFDGLLNLPPDPNSEHQAGSMHRLAVAAGECRCLAKRTRIGETDVRGKFTRDLVTKPYAAIEIGQSRSNAPCRICLAVEIHFDLRLQYQALTEIQIVRALDSSRDASSIANIQRGCKIEEVRSKSL